MKLLGMIGGVSWVSTMEYYKFINEGINEKLGDLNFAKCMIYSLNYEEIKRNNDRDDWDANYKIVSEACKHLESSGAKGIVLCANTMHLIADRLQSILSIPIIHIATATAAEIKKQNLTRVALLGTKFTMERNFYSDKLKESGIERIIPNDADRDFIHYTIFEELGRGIILPETKQRYLSIINSLKQQGAQGVILGCTEIPLLLSQTDLDIPAFDTTLIHSRAAIEFSLS